MTLSLSDQRNKIASRITDFFPHFSEKRVIEATIALEKLQKHGKKSLTLEEKKSLSDQTYFSYFGSVEFEERATPNNPNIMEKIAKGVAIYPATSNNHSLYEKEELIKAAPSLKGRPFQEDHSFKARETIGTVRKVTVDKETGITEFEAGLDPNDPVTRKIEAGHIKHVSVLGSSKAFCTFCEEEYDWFHDHVPGRKYEGKVMKVRHTNIKYLHLGATNYPGIPNAKINSAESIIQEDYVDERGGMFISTIDAYSMLREDMTRLFSENITELDFSKDKDIIGETKMPDEEKAKIAELTKKVELLLAESKTKDSELSDFKESKASLEKVMKEERIGKIIEQQVRLGILTEDKVPTKKLELSELNSDMLQERLNTLKEWEDFENSKKGNDDPSPQYGKSKADWDKESQVKPRKLSVAEIFEAETMYLSEIFWGPDFISETAVAKLKMFDSGQDMWKTPASIIKKTAVK